MELERTDGRRDARRIDLPNCVVDLEHQQVIRKGRYTSLTRIETRVLEWMAQHPGRTIPRSELLEQVWGYRQGVRSRTVDTTIQRLRAKIDAPEDRRETLRTVRGQGYCLEIRPTPRLGQRDAPSDPVGRIEQRDQLRRLLGVGTRLVGLFGPPGIGKTRLAKQISDWFVATKSEGPAPQVLWLDLDADSSPTRLAARELRLAWLNERSSAAASYRITQAFDRPNTLVVLDGLRTEDSWEEVLAWTDSISAAQLLCTSQQRHDSCTEFVEVPPLSADEAVALFHQQCPRVLNKADEVHLEALIADLNGIPAAISWVAAKGRVSSITELREQVSAGLHPCLQAGYQGAIAQLNGPDQQALARLSSYPCTFGLTQARWVLDLGTSATLACLSRLESRYLLVGRPHPTRQKFAVPEVVRRQVLALQPKQITESWHGFAHGLGEMLDLADQSGARIETQLEECIATFLLVFAHLQPDQPRTMADLAARMVSKLLTRIPASQSLPLLDASIEGLKKGASCPTLARCLAVRGELRQRIGWGRASLEDLHDALKLTEEMDIPLIEIQVRHRLAISLRASGKTQEASEMLDLATRQLPSNHSSPAQIARRRALLLVSQAKLARLSRKNVETERLLGEAIEVLTIAGTEEDSGPAVAELAVLFEETGRFAQAASCFRRALHAADRLGDRLQSQVFAIKFAAHLLQHGQTEEAEARLKDVIEAHEGLFKQTGSTQITGGLMGAILIEKGDLDAATDVLSGCREAYRRGGRVYGEADVLSDLARACHLRGRLEEASSLLDEAVALLGPDKGHSGPLWQILCLRGMVSAQRGEFTAAAEDLRVVRGISQKPIRSRGMLAIAEAWLHWAKGESAAMKAALERAAPMIPHSTVTRIAAAQLEKLLAG